MLRPVLLRLSLSQNYQVPTLCRGLSSSVNKLKLSGDQKRSFYDYSGVHWLWNKIERKLTCPTKLFIPLVLDTCCVEFYGRSDSETFDISQFAAHSGQEIQDKFRPLDFVCEHRVR